MQYHTICIKRARNIHICLYIPQTLEEVEREGEKNI